MQSDQEMLGWYLAELIIEIFVSCSPKNVVHRNLTLIRAYSADEAYDRAITIGHQSETSYENPKGQCVEILFRGVSKLEEMYEDPEDGAELRFDETVGVSQNEIQQWIPSKDQLQAFRSPKPGREYEPDYRSKEVMDMAVAQLNSNVDDWDK